MNRPISLKLYSSQETREHVTKLNQIVNYLPMIAETLARFDTYSMTALFTGPRKS